MGALHHSFALLLLKDDPVWAWRDRLLSAFGGFAGKALDYPVYCRR